jgi:hypothetical protein
MLLLLAAAIAPSGLPHPPAASAPDILAQSRAAYAALNTYADSGTVELEYGTPGNIVREYHTFRTYFRRPRSFYFEFVKQRDTDRYVVWSDAEAFHSWWRSLGTQQDFPKGSGAAAFAQGTVPTSGSLPQIASLLWPDAALVSTLSELGEVTDAGTEAVDGRPCHKLTAFASSRYGRTGREVNARPVTVWIDVQTLLVRKVVEDSPRGTVADFLNRTTTVFRPHANPPLDEVSFRFTPAR